MYRCGEAHCCRFGESHTAQTRLSVRPAPSISLREALATPKSTRTATQNRATLGSRALSRTLNLAETLGRLVLFPLTRVGMARTLRSVRCPAPAERDSHARSVGLNERGDREDAFWRAACRKPALG
jgi:hypothetical protein